MARLAFLLLCGLAAACTGSDSSRTGDAADVQGWRFASGKAPTRAEYTAVVAACQAGAVQRLEGKPLAVCLADLGLRRSP